MICRTAFFRLLARDMSASLGLNTLDDVDGPTICSRVSPPSPPLSLLSHMSFSCDSSRCFSEPVNDEDERRESGEAGPVVVGAVTAAVMIGRMVPGGRGVA